MMTTYKIRDHSWRWKRSEVHQKGLRCWRAVSVTSVLLLLLFVGAGSGFAQSSGQLAVSVKVQSSIQLVFKNNVNTGAVGYCPLVNPNTNNVGLDLGSAWVFGIQNANPCASYLAMGFGQYQVSSAFDVWVTKANTSSANYRLAAQISSAPPANVNWLINGTTLNNTSYTALDASNSYNTAVTKALQVQATWNVAAQALQETITFLASAN